MPDCFLRPHSGSLGPQGLWSLGRPLLPVDAAEVVVIPLQRGLTSKMASALQTLLSGVSSSVSVPHRRHQGLAALARRQGSHGCFVCLSLLALILTARSLSWKPYPAACTCPRGQLCPLLLLSSGREDRTHQGLHFHGLYRA